MFSDTDSSLDWIIRHGRAVALSIAVKEAGEKILTDEFTEPIYKAALSYTAADRVSS